MRLSSLISALIAGALLSLSGPDAGARQTDRSLQAVSVSVRPIVALAVTPVSTPILMSPGPASGSELTWAITTNGSGLELLARLDAPLPHGIQLVVSAESGLGEGRESVRISADSPAAIVSSIGRGREKGQLIDLQLLGDLDLDIPVQSLSVTFTLVDPVSGASDSVTRQIRIGSDPEPLRVASPAIAGARIADSVRR